MSAPINRKQKNVSGTGPKPWIQMNRWDNNVNYSLVIKITGTALVNVEGTLDYINRGDEVVAFPIEKAQNISETTYLNIFATPFEALRVNQTTGDGTVDFHVMQGGSCD